MIVYLTSNLGAFYKKNGVRIPKQIGEQNKLLINLKTDWTQNAKCLFVSGSPENAEKSSIMKEVYYASFTMSGLSVNRIDTWDISNQNEINDIRGYDVILLAGGHVPSQNNFMKIIRLKEKLVGFEGIILGVSAGSMNAANIVYALPEYDGESISPNDERFPEGLGLTEIKIIPHYCEILSSFVDGKNAIEDIAISDSFGKKFYGIQNGSYIRIKDGKQTLYGEAFIIQDGTIRQVCENEKEILL